MVYNDVFFPVFFFKLLMYEYIILVKDVFGSSRSKKMFLHKIGCKLYFLEDIFRNFLTLKSFKKKND